MYRNTVFGRRMLATGGNASAARLSGINTAGMVVWAHVLSGAFAALAAVLWASKLGSAAPETGDDWLIVSFAVAIIGGTGLNGGVISALGVFMGSAIFMLIKHGLVEVKANPYYANSFLGLLILLAIVVDRVREIYSDRQKAK
jgi:ribose transport system permease protein